MKLIPLTQGKFAKVDDEDFERLTPYSWYYQKQLGYATARVDGLKTYMHRFIIDTPKGLITDHINRNKLDNRKYNLRVVNKAGNQRNHKVFSTNTSGVNGVSWNKAMQKWETYIWVNNIKKKLGYFKDIKKAYSVRINAEARLWA
jgi:hypothetical protein